MSSTIDKLKFIPPGDVSGGVVPVEANEPDPRAVGMIYIQAGVATWEQVLEIAKSAPDKRGLIAMRLTRSEVEAAVASLQGLLARREDTCCTRGTWDGLEWTSECHDWHIEIETDGPAGLVISIYGDLWEFRDELYGTEDEAKAYALDVLHGVSDEDRGIASAVARAKAADSARRQKVAR